MRGYTYVFSSFQLSNVTLYSTVKYVLFVQVYVQNNEQQGFVKHFKRSCHGLLHNPIMLEIRNSEMIIISSLAIYVFIYSMSSFDILSHIKPSKPSSKFCGDIEKVLKVYEKSYSLNVRTQ